MLVFNIKILIVFNIKETVLSAYYFLKNILNFNLSNMHSNFKNKKLYYKKHFFARPCHIFFVANLIKEN